MPQQPPLIRILIARQGDASDRAFARKLGISHARWGQIKAGEEPGLPFLRAVLSVYPDLALQAAAFLMPPDAALEADSARTETATAAVPA